MQNIKEKYSEELQLLQHTKNYLSGKVFLKGLGFITLPIFTRLLTVEDFGTISLYRFTISILIIVFSLSINTSISRYFFENKRDFDSFLGFHLIGISIYISLLGVVLLMFSQPISQVVGLKITVFRIAILISALSVYITIFQGLNIVQKKSAFFSTFQVFQQLSVIILSIALIAILLSDKFMGRVYGDLLIIPFFFIAIYNLINRGRVKFKKDYFIYTAHVAFPSVPGMLAGIALVQIDRLFINHYVGIEETGLYSYAYVLGMVIVIISSSIMSSWEPRFFELMNNRKIVIINRITIRMIWLICAISAVIILFASEVSSIIAPARFQDAAVIIPIVLISYIINDHAGLYGKYVLYDKRYIPYTPLAVIIAGLINISLNYTMIPIFGYKIAAITTLISYLSLFAFYYYFAIKAMKVETIKLKYFLQPYLLVTGSIIVYYLSHYLNMQILHQVFIKLSFLSLVILYKLYKNNKRLI